MPHSAAWRTPDLPDTKLPLRDALSDSADVIATKTSKIALAAELNGPCADRALW